MIWELFGSLEIGKWRLVEEDGLRYRLVMDKDGLPTKVVGRKGKPKVNLETANGFLHLMKTLRGNRPFIPKGVWRFKSFEEADEWTLKMITRR